MSPPSRLLPEVSGFSISFIGGSGGGRGGRDWRWDLVALHSRLQVERVVSFLWNGMERNVLCSPDLKNQPSAHCLFSRYRYTQSLPSPSYPPSLTWNWARNLTCQPEVSPFQGSLR